MYCKYKNSYEKRWYDFTKYTRKKLDISCTQKIFNVLLYCYTEGTSDDQINVAVIAGAAAGGCVLLIVVILVVCMFRR